jgi:hypothetical protein
MSAGEWSSPWVIVPFRSQSYFGHRVIVRSQYSSGTTPVALGEGGLVSSR